MRKKKVHNSSEVDFKEVFNILSKEFQSTLTKFVEVINASVAAAEEKNSEKQFYPATLTSFFKPGLGTQEVLLSVAEAEDGPVKYGTVNFVDASGEECYWDDWLGSVRSGLIEVVYCPKMGRVNSNSDYLKYWGLSQ